MIAPAYRYRATLDHPEAKVLDGDTYRLAVLVGFHVFTVIDGRLRGYSCPEINTVEGIAAASDADKILRSGDIIVESYRDRRSFARWVIDVWVGGEPLGPTLVALGVAEAS